MELHERIRISLRSARMSMAALARYCDVSRSAVSLWVHPDAERRTTPTDESLRCVAQATGINFDWLAGRTTEGGPDPEHLEAESIAQRRRYRINAFQRAEGEVREMVRDVRPDLVTYFDRSASYMEMRWPFDFISERLVLSIRPISPLTGPRMFRIRTLTSDLWRLAIWAKLDNEMINLRAHTLILLNMNSDEQSEFELRQEPENHAQAEAITKDIKRLTKQAELFDIKLQLCNSPKEVADYILELHS